MARSELSRLRDIAYKRIKRAERRGETSLPSFPTIKEAQKSGQLEQLEADLKRWLEPPAQLPEVPARMPDAEERRKQKHREAQRKYYESTIKPLTKKQKSLIKGLKTMGIRIPYSMVPAYEQYIKARYDLGLDAETYFIVTYAEDFSEAVRKKIPPEKIMEDFQNFALHMAELKTRSEKDLSKSSLRESLQIRINKLLGREW